MDITRIEPRVIAEPSGRSYVVLKVMTDEGYAGYGEAPVGADPQATVDHLKRELANEVGANATRTLLADLRLQRADASHGARAALNMALLDILGKSTKAPLYEVLGGPTRNKARAMAVIDSGTNARIRSAVLEAKSVGHKAYSIPLEVPATRERGRAFFVDIRTQLEALREATGSDHDFVLDCGGKTNPGEAISIADRMETFHLLWLDEPTPDLNSEAQATISRNSVTPVGFGRHFDENSRFQDLLQADGIDVMRPDLATTTITNIRKAAAIVETHYIAISPFHRGGPIGTAAGIHISACLPNSFIQETPFSTNEADRRMRQAISGGWDEAPVDGFFQLLEGPGLGLQVDDAALAEYTVAS